MSQPESPPTDVMTLWLEEAARRAAEIDEGKVTLVEAEELERRVRARLNRAPPTLD